MVVNAREDDLALEPLQYMNLLRHLHQVTARGVLCVPLLRDLEKLGHTLTDGLRPVLGKAVRPHVGPAACLFRQVDEVAQASHQRMLAVVAVYQHLVPGVDRDLVHRQYQVFPQATVAERVGTLGGQQDIQFTVVGQGVDAHVDQQQHIVGDARLQQAHLADGGQRQHDELLQACEQTLQFRLFQIADTRMKRQSCMAVYHAIAMGPDQQLRKVPAALDRVGELHFMAMQVTAVECPGVATWRSAAG